MYGPIIIPEGAAHPDLARELEVQRIARERFRRLPSGAMSPEEGVADAFNYAEEFMRVCEERAEAIHPGASNNYPPISSEN